MIQLILDTNIYKTDITRNNAAFRTLEVLLKKAVIKLHIPFFIENEFISFLNDEYENKVIKAHRAINWLNQITYLSDKQKNQFLSEEFNKEKIISHLQSSFNKWIKNISAITYKLEFDDCKKAITAYFKGEPPHRSRRDRENIPDSFIFQEVAKIRNNHNEVHFVSMDGKFRNSCKSHLTNIITYTKLDEFVTSDICKSFSQINEDEKSSLITYITKNSTSLATDLSSKVVNFLTEKTINSDKIPDDNNEATINGVYNPDNIIFNLEHSIYYGGGIIVVPCNFKTEVSVYYYIYKPDYYAMEKNISVSDHSDHYYAAEESIEISVDARARFEFDISDLANIELLDCDMDSLERVEVI